MDYFVNQKIKELWTDSLDSVFKQISEYCIPGRYFYYIFDIDRLEYLWISDSTAEVLGYSKNDIDILQTLENIHPDDLPWFAAIEKQIELLSRENGHEWLSEFKIIYDCRFKNKSGEYMRLLRQMIQLKDENINRYVRYGIVTDISHIKEEGRPSLSFLSLGGGESLFNVPLDIRFQDNSPFTKREKEIISLIIQGYISKEIAEKLFISLNTVKNHKKNIFSKAHCNSVTQLFKKCITSGWNELYLKPSR